MKIEATVSWPSLLSMPARCPLRLVADWEGAEFAEWPRPVAGSRVLIAVGPEGGLTDLEVQSALAAGWLPVGLGPSILRVETAGLAASARLLALAELGAAEGSIRPPTVNFSIPARPDIRPPD
jgi:16S rRNA (uracil1498-N3)-methyltransferase